MQSPVAFIRNAYSDTQHRLRFVCAGMYLYSGALSVVEGLKGSMRPEAALELGGVEDMHDRGYVLLRIPLPRTPVNEPKTRPSRGCTVIAGLL